jgi:hypothetical protein
MKKQFIIPPPRVFCPNWIEGKCMCQPHEKGDIVEVVRIEAKDGVVFNKAAIVKNPCGAEVEWSILYFWTMEEAKKVKKTPANKSI